jgi:DNA-binding helix-hairpin-helix protein with protein kinase domain
MRATILVNSSGRPVSLRSKVGTGGEGSVFAVEGEPGLVAKVYHKPPQPAHAAKLRAMVGLAKPDLCGVAAWPTATLSERPGGDVIGLVMRRITGYKEIHTLYSPAHRKVSFPQADWRFLVHTAANCAAAFETLHGSGVVVGDVNQSNVMVSEKGYVSLIDCDSFQLQVGGRTYPCEVGVPLFTPPELQGQSFRGRERAANHDRFGLAVLIFHLLFMGRHPFSGRYGGPGDMPIERAIREYRFAYGAAARSFQMLPPLHAPSLSYVSPQLGGLFERAFGPTGSTKPRPSPNEWHGALTGFLGTLHRCPRDPGHQTPTHLGHCVWCELMGQGAPNFFVSVSFSVSPVTRPGAQFVLAAVWTRIESVPRPGPVSARPAVSSNIRPRPWPSGIPIRLPPRPAQPAILSAAPRAPEPQLPPPRHSKRVVPRGRAQRAAALTALALVMFLVPVVVLGGAIGQLISIPASVVAWGLGAFELFLALLCGACWLWLELVRREAERGRNREYEREQEERRESARQQLRAWKHRLRQEQEAARRPYENALRGWEGAAALIRAEAERRRERFREASLAVEQTERAWADAAAPLAQEFDRRKVELAKFRDRHSELSASYAAERQRLVARAHEMQRALYLQQEFICDHDIPDIGPTRRATLTSFGIETAFDVEERAIRGIPGFGPKLTGRLLDWRRSVEAKFVFNAGVGVPAQEQRALDLKYYQERQPVEMRLLDGERQLREIAHRADRVSVQYKESLRDLFDQKDQAAADLTVIPATT